MSKFWQKKYISKYTGAEIDAAVAAGSQVPEIDIEDAGKILAVDAEGKIVAKTDPVPAVTVADAGSALVVDGQGKIAVQEPFVINVTGTVTAQGFSATTTATPAQVKAAVLAGKSITLYFTGEGFEFSFLNVPTLLMLEYFAPIPLLINFNSISIGVYGILAFYYDPLNPNDPFNLSVDTITANV